MLNTLKVIGYLIDSNFFITLLAVLNTILNVICCTSTYPTVFNSIAQSDVFQFNILFVVAENSVFNIIVYHMVSYISLLLTD